MVLDYNGNVGIKTDSPVLALDVSGDDIRMGALPVETYTPPHIEIVLKLEDLMETVRSGLELKVDTNSTTNWKSDNQSAIIFKA